MYVHSAVRTIGRFLPSLTALLSLVARRLTESVASNSNFTFALHRHCSRIKSRRHGSSGIRAIASARAVPRLTARVQRYGIRLDSLPPLSDHPSTPSPSPPTRTADTTQLKPALATFSDHSRLSMHTCEQGRDRYRRVQRCRAIWFVSPAAASPRYQRWPGPARGRTLLLCSLSSFTASCSARQIAPFQKHTHRNRNTHTRKGVEECVARDSKPKILNPNHGASSRSSLSRGPEEDEEKGEGFIQNRTRARRDS